MGAHWARTSSVQLLRAHSPLRVLCVFIDKLCDLGSRMGRNRGPAAPPAVAHSLEPDSAAMLSMPRETLWHGSGMEANGRAARCPPLLPSVAPPLLTAPPAPPATLQALSTYGARANQRKPDGEPIAICAEHSSAPLPGKLAVLFHSPEVIGLHPLQPALHPASLPSWLSQLPQPYDARSRWKPSMTRMSTRMCTMVANAIDRVGPHGLGRRLALSLVASRLRRPLPKPPTTLPNALA